jgi:phage shock protein PspC (stress-responsive transcriptional regulator)
MVKWVRSRDGLVAGVFEGIGRLYGINPIVLRLMWICSVFFLGFGFFLYIVLAVLMPLEGREKNYNSPMILGVCERIAQNWGHELVMIRVLFFGAFLLSGGLMFFVYLGLHFLMPYKQISYHHYYERNY